MAHFLLPPRSLVRPQRNCCQQSQEDSETLCSAEGGVEKGHQARQSPTPTPGLQAAVMSSHLMGEPITPAKTLSQLLLPTSLLRRLSKAQPWTLGSHPVSGPQHPSSCTACHRLLSVHSDSSPQRLASQQTHLLHPVQSYSQASFPGSHSSPLPFSLSSKHSPGAARGGMQGLTDG